MTPQQGRISRQPGWIPAFFTLALTIAFFLLEANNSALMENNQASNKIDNCPARHAQELQPGMERSSRLLVLF